jgi:cytidyltransferase-like protein
MYKQKVFVYAGSFNPFHKGHQQIVHYLQKKCKELSINCLYILPNNPSKKQNRLSLTHRINIIKMYEWLDNGVNVEIIGEKGDDFISSFGDVELYSCMGMDQYTHLLNQNKKPHLLANTWYITPRIDNYIDESIDLIDGINLDWNSNIVFVNQSELTNINFSSTLCRNAFSSKDYDLLGTMMIDASIHYMSLFNLYLGEYKENYKEYKSNVIRYNNNIIKIFYGEIGIEKWKRETNMNNIIKLYDMLPIAHMKESYIIDNIGFIIFEWIEGSSIMEIINDQSKYPELDWSHISYLIGETLATFHCNTLIPITKDNVSTFDIGKKLGISQNILVDGIYFKSYIHGDVSPNNICITCENGNFSIYFIDLEKGSTYLNECDEPEGVACYDFLQFVSGVKFYSDKKENENINKIIIEGFTNGYIKTYFKLTEKEFEISPYVVNYWNNKTKN